MEAKKKILFIITKSNMGGAQRYVLELASSLPAHEYEVSVAFGGEGILKEKLEAQGIQTHTIKSFARDINIFKELQSMAELYTLIQKVQPDIVHLNSSKAGGTGALIARLCGVKQIVFTAHGWPFYEPRSVIARGIIWALSYLTTLLAHAVIVVSEHDRRHARMWGLEKKLVCIPTALPFITFKTRDEARNFFSTRYQIPLDGFWIGTIAEYTKNKNLHLLIRAVEQLRKEGQSVRCVLIGAEGDESASLRTYIRDHKLEMYIHLIGFVDDARTYLKAFDAFVLPSLKEGMPYALLEAGRAGVPAIGSDVGGIPEIITHDVHGLLINPRNANALHKALSELISNKTNTQNRAHVLMEKVRDNFGSAAMVERTRAIYESKGSFAS